MEEKFIVAPIPDSFNVNGHYYTKESLDAAITAYKEKIADGRAPVMMGYPKPNVDGVLPLDIDLSKIIGQVTDIEFEDGKYVASVKFQRPTKEILDIINNKSSYSIGLNKTGQIKANREVYDINILSASLALDPRLERSPMEDLDYFIKLFKTNPYDVRLRNQVVTLIDSIHITEKARHGEEKE